MNLSHTFLEEIFVIFHRRYLSFFYLSYGSRTSIFAHKKAARLDNLSSFAAIPVLIYLKIANLSIPALRLRSDRRLL